MYKTIWVFPKIVVPQNGWFIMKNLIKIDDLGVPLFFRNIHREKQQLYYQNSKTSTSIFQHQKLPLVFFFAIETRQFIESMDLPGKKSGINKHSGCGSKMGDPECFVDVFPIIKHGKLFQPAMLVYQRSRG